MRRVGRTLGAASGNGELGKEGVLRATGRTVNESMLRTVGQGADSMEGKPWGGARPRPVPGPHPNPHPDVNPHPIQSTLRTCS